ncbi:GNAT family N-acetyltransferase [Algirhabdus cladophorae]|uniref:GNAT family N-acetyltransferase n=1 Tax=Algirhabdus cladophorae TaxID=3377108 RepID=UPI003B84AA0D
MKIAVESPLTQDAANLIDGSEAALREVYTPDECFTFTASELDSDDIIFLVARDDGNQAIGCVALCDYQTYGEVKRLFVPPAGRGQGTARALMDELEERARLLGHADVKLETGEKLAAAVALYASMGYEKCGPFGEYPEHPASLFMTKGL